MVKVIVQDSFPSLRKHCDPLDIGLRTRRQRPCAHELVLPLLLEETAARQMPVQALRFRLKPFNGVLLPEYIPVAVPKIIDLLLLLCLLSRIVAES